MAKVLLDRRSYLIAISALGVVAAGSLGATVTLLAKRGQFLPYFESNATTQSAAATELGVSTSPAADGQSTGIFINDHEISKEQAAGLKQMYDVSLTAGRYWYDARSGLYGHAGGGTLGYMRPGHDFGR